MLLRSILLILPVILSGCVTPNPEYFSLREGVIPVNQNHTGLLKVDGVEIGETVTRTFILNLTSEDIKKKLEDNLVSYNLIKRNNEPEYAVHARYDFSAEGWMDIHMTCSALYSVTNLTSQNTAEYHVNETYVAEVSSDMFTSALIGAAVAGVAAGVGASLATDNHAAIASAAAASATAYTYTIGPEYAEQYEAEREKLREVAYAKEGTPLTAFPGDIRTENAYEGSIRLNMASFIEMLYEKGLPE